MVKRSPHRATARVDASSTSSQGSSCSSICVQSTASAASSAAGAARATSAAQTVLTCTINQTRSRRVSAAACRHSTYLQPKQRRQYSRHSQPSSSHRSTRAASARARHTSLPSRSIARWHHGAQVAPAPTHRVRRLQGRHLACKGVNSPAKASSIRLQRASNRLKRRHPRQQWRQRRPAALRRGRAPHRLQ
jgi:hypothetical protein